MNYYCSPTRFTTEKLTESNINDPKWMNAAEWDKLQNMSAS
jgi:hypothetical protein